MSCFPALFTSLAVVDSWRRSYLSMRQLSADTGMAAKAMRLSSPVGEKYTVAVLPRYCSSGRHIMS